MPGTMTSLDTYFSGCRDSVQHTGQQVRDTGRRGALGSRARHRVALRGGIEGAWCRDAARRPPPAHLHVAHGHVRHAAAPRLTLEQHDLYSMGGRGVQVTCRPTAAHQHCRAMARVKPYCAAAANPASIMQQQRNHGSTPCHGMPSRHSNSRRSKHSTSSRRSTAAGTAQAPACTSFTSGSPPSSSRLWMRWLSCFAACSNCRQAWAGEQAEARLSCVTLSIVHHTRPQLFKRKSAATYNGQVLCRVLHQCSGQLRGTIHLSRQAQQV